MPILRKGGITQKYVNGHTSKNTSKSNSKGSIKKSSKNGKQSGGAIMDVNDFDYNQIAISKHVKIDWGTAPGPPPMDCCIM
jgi:hypothetical protein